jgi:NADP-dependent 3-hydroxy acid dehydrogenase YdfG
MTTTAPVVPAPEGAAWILGAGPGLGLAVARAFGAQGLPVVLMARSMDRLAAMVDTCRANGVAAAGVAGDLGDADGLRDALHDAERLHGPCAVLTHNASVLIEGPPSAVDPGAVEQGLRVGVLSALIALQSVLPGMVARGRGRLLFTGGGTALEPWVSGIGLSLQKAALRSLAIATARELSTGPVRASTITIMGTIGSPGLEPGTIASRYVDLWRSDNPPEEVQLSPQ